MSLHTDPKCSPLVEYEKLKDVFSDCDKPIMLYVKEHRKKAYDAADHSADIRRVEIDGLHRKFQWPGVDGFRYKIIGMISKRKILVIYLP